MPLSSLFRMSVPLRCTRDMDMVIELLFNTDLDLKLMTTFTLRPKKAEIGMNSTTLLRESMEPRLMTMSHHMTLRLLMLQRT